MFRVYTITRNKEHYSFSLPVSASYEELCEAVEEKWIFYKIADYDFKPVIDGKVGRHVIDSQVSVAVASIATTR